MLPWPRRNAGRLSLVPAAVVTRWGGTSLRGGPTRLLIGGAPGTHSPEKSRRGVRDLSEKAEERAV